MRKRNDAQQRKVHLGQHLGQRVRLWKPVRGRGGTGPEGRAFLGKVLLRMGRPEQSHWRDSNYPRGTGRWWGGAGRADEGKGSGNQKEAEVRARCSLHSLGKGAARNCGLSSLTYCSQCSFRSGHKLPCPPGLASSLTAGTKEEALVRALITVMLSVPTLQTFCSFQHDL